MKTTALAALCVSARPRRMYLRYLLPGVVMFGLVQQANADSVRDCAQDHIALNQRLVERMPGDPRRAKAIARLLREGAELCHEGDSSAGRAMLREAAGQLDPSAHDVPNSRR